MIQNISLEESDTLQLQFAKRGGLLPVVVQDVQTNRILMLGYVNELALRQSLEKKMATFWSTSRNALWTKGETSGDYLQLQEVWVDCDQDALIFRVACLGEGVCHTKEASGRSRTSCFYRYVDDDRSTLLFKEN